MMIARYGPPSNIVASTIPLHHHGSAIWKEILTWSLIVLPHLRWIIGDGRRIDFMIDAWIYDAPLARWPAFIFMDTPDSISISDLLLRDSSC